MNVGLFILVFAVVATVLILLYLGFFKSLHIKDSRIGPFPLIFRDFKGDFDKLDSHLAKFRADTEKYFSPDKSFKIYYDNPLAVSQKSKVRAVYGLILDKNEPLERIQKFCKRFEDIKFRMLPEIPCIYIKLENKKQFRFNQSMFCAKVLPKLVLALKQKLELSDNNVSFVGLVEILELQSVGNKPLRYAIPYGENTNPYFMTKHPEPEFDSKT